MVVCFAQQAKVLTQLMEGVVDATGGRLTQKRSYAATWWKEILYLMDWLPNEQRIRIRGPGFLYLHKEVYGPKAKASGMYLEYKAWKRSMAQGIVDVCRELPGADPKRVKCGRTANHSNFPECSECQSRRNRWLSAAKSVSSDPAVVQYLYNQLLEHNREWHADRSVALAIRRANYNPDSAHAIYENDDKCGSHTGLSCHQ